MRILPITHVKRGLARASTCAAEGAVWALGERSMIDRLAWVMDTPLRRLLLEAVFWQMPRHLDASRAVGTRSTARWRITGRSDGELDVYDLVLEEGRCRAIRGERCDDPRLTITIDRNEFFRLITGNSDPLRAYFNRRLALSGDVMFAAKLVSIARIPKSRAAAAA